MKIQIDKSKWNRALDNPPKDGEKVFYWFEPVGLFIGKFELDYCEELDTVLHTFYSKFGFLSDEDVYWLPITALPVMLEEA